MKQAPNRRIAFVRHGPHPQLAKTIADDQALARIDALARSRGVSRDEMIAHLVRVGVNAESDAAHRANRE